MQYLSGSDLAARLYACHIYLLSNNVQKFVLRESIIQERMPNKEMGKIYTLIVEQCNLLIYGISCCVNYCNYELSITICSTGQLHNNKTTKMSSMYWKKQANCPSFKICAYLSTLSQSDKTKLSDINAAQQPI